MVFFPSFDRYDAAILVASLVLLFFAYVIYPHHLVQISVWFIVFTLYLSWMAYFLWKWMFEAEL